MTSISSDIIEQWRTLKGQEALEFYFGNILSLAVEMLQEKKLPDDLKNKDWACLVSLMGFSPETTVLVAAAIRPKLLHVITSDESIQNYDLAHKYLIDNKIMKPHQIRINSIRPDNPRQIYDVVTDAIRSSNSACSLVDVTGGKKIMSATAGQAAWEMNVPLCYVDGQYDSVIRRPVPGTEKLILLLDPSQIRPRNARQTSVTAWKMRQFHQAKDLFTTSLNLNQEHHLEDIAIPLCRAFAALMDFRLPEVELAVEELEHVASRPYLADIAARLNLHRTINAFKHDPLLRQAPTRVAAFLSLADVYAEQRRHDFASLLAYRALEASIQEGLRLKAGGNFDTGTPNWGLLGIPEAELEVRYCEMSKKIDSSSEQEKHLPRKLGLVNGFCILSLTDPDLVSRIFHTDNRLEAAIRKVRDISSTRNCSILAHGTTTLGEKEFKDIADLARKISRAVMPDERIDQLVSDLRPPAIEELIYV